MTVQGAVALILFLAGITQLASRWRKRRGLKADQALPAKMLAAQRLRHRARRALLPALGIVLIAIGGNSLPAFPILRSPLLGLIGRYKAMRPVAGDPTCTAMTRFAFAAVDARGDEPDGGPARCGLQSVVNAGASDARARVPASICWPANDSPVVDPPLCYKLGFLEFDEAGRLRAPDQLDRIRRVYAEGREVFTITYVHGWRHDAQLGDKDVRRLRVAASYASSHLLERCRVVGRHCGAVVLAIFVAWPGSIGLADGDARAWAAVNFLTFASRKNLTDVVGTSVLARLSELHRASRAAGTHASNRTLLLGHSLGGNLLLSGATPGLIAGLGRVAVALRRADAQAAAADGLGLPADLTVLMNPASEAAKLDRLRRIEASLFATRTTRQSHLPLFPDTTPPRLLILSAGCGKLQMVRAGPDDHDVKCDVIVGTAFWASQVAEGHWEELQRLGIGHVPPSGTNTTVRRLASMTLETNYQQRGLPGFYERDPFAGSGIRPWYRWSTTTYPNAHDRLTTTCLPEPAWLVCARRRGTRTDRVCAAFDQSDRWRPWTTGDGSKGETTLDRFAESGTPGQSNVQFQYGLARLGSGDWRVETQRADPVWAVQADLTSIAGHSQIASAPLMCALNKLVLDDVLATDGRTPQDHVAAFRADWEARAGGDALRRRAQVAAQERRWKETRPQAAAR